MAIIVKSSGDFIPAPEGLHNAVCVDVIDKGMCETPWGDKHKLRIVWEIGFLMEDGKPFIVGKTYTASLHEKSSLFKDLKAWRGKPFTAEELKAFDVENVIGAPCQVLVQHTEKEGTVFANVTAIMKAAPGGPATKLKPSGCYTRVKDRPDYQPPGASQNGQHGQTEMEPAAAAEEDSDIPF